MNDITKYDQAVGALSERLRSRLLAIPHEIKYTVREIRLRSGRPLSISTGQKDYYILEAGGTALSPRAGVYTVTPQDVSDSFRVLCGYSIHSCQNEIRGGYITVEGGHRAGICGSAIVEDGQVSGLREISSINLRVARQIYGAATDLIDRTYPDGVCGTLIVGSPASGKTTVLKDLIRQLASGADGSCRKIAVIDERGEIAAMHKGRPQNDLGVSADIFDGYPKGEGMNIAIRSMAPEIIVCDEIGSQEDAEAILNSLNAGVKVIATAHAASMRELSSRRHIMELIETGAFPKIVLLKGAKEPSKVAEVLEVGEFIAEDRREPAAHRSEQHDWTEHVGKFVKESL